MAQTRPKTTTDPAKALGKKITNHERRIRDLELHPDPPAFTPVGAAIYDANWIDSPHAASFIQWRAEDLDIDVDGNASILINAGDFVPPTFDERWFAYVWYDDGFGTAGGNRFFTTPSEGIYAAHARVVFSPGMVESITLEVSFTPPTSSTVHVATTQMIGVGAEANLPVFVPLEAGGISHMDEGAEVQLEMNVQLLVPPGWSPTDIIFQLNRVQTSTPPPIEAPLSRGPGTGPRFTIQKIGNTGLP